MVRYFFLWFVLLVIAIGNGAFRQAVLMKIMPELRAHQLSTLLGGVLMGVFMWLVIHTWPPASQLGAFQIGLLWFCVTIIFETFMGLVLQRRSRTEVLADYNLMKGRVWILLLGWLLIAPSLFYFLM